MKIHPAEKNGFTLVELAISLVVIGLLVAMGAAMTGALITASKNRESSESLAAVVESINSHAAGNNRLPDSAGFPSAVRTPQDAWGRDLLYLYDANLSVSPPTKDTICGRRSTPVSLVTTAPAATIPNVAYIVLSGGEDTAVQATLAGTLNGAASGPAIAPGTRGYITGSVTLDALNRDLARWVTLDELRTKMGCQGAQLRIVNNELPFGAAPTAYSVTITADGGVPFATGPNTYKWCISTLPAGFTQTGGIEKASCIGTNETTFAAASAGLTISFPPATVATGAYRFEVVVRDNAESGNSTACDAASPGDNCSQKVFVVTVNPS